MTKRLSYDILIVGSGITGDEAEGNEKVLLILLDSPSIA
jgi:hypothetical protein